MLSMERARAIMSGSVQPVDRDERERAKVMMYAEHYGASTQTISSRLGVAPLLSGICIDGPCEGQYLSRRKECFFIWGGTNNTHYRVGQYVWFPYGIGDKGQWVWNDFSSGTEEALSSWRFEQAGGCCHV